MKQKPTTEPTRRPNRWARLKKQLRQARAEATIAKRGEQWANLFITQQGQWQEFSKWAMDNAEAEPTDVFAKMYAEASNNAKNLLERLKLSQAMGKMYEEQKDSFCKMICNLNSQMDKLQTMLITLIERNAEKRDEIAGLKQKLSQYEANTD